EQRRRPEEAALPESELPLEDLAAQPPPLPGREVAILDGQLRQRRRPTGAQALVDQTQLTDEQAHRAVENDVVSGHQQQVLPAVDSQQQAAQQGSALEIERSPDLGGAPVPGFGPGPLGKRVEVNEG